MKGAVVETFAISEMLKARTNIAKKGNLTYDGIDYVSWKDWGSY